MLLRSWLVGSFLFLLSWLFLQLLPAVIVVARLFAVFVFIAAVAVFTVVVVLSVTAAEAVNREFI